MMIDYNVSDHWSDDDPDWLKSLVSSLDRRHGLSSVVPLTVIVEEIAEWVELASGTDAWKTSANRSSLQLDLDESMGAVGANLSNHIAGDLAAFRAALLQLSTSPKAVLTQPPGTRTDAVWTSLLCTARVLLEVLDSDDAARASWDDLVATAQDRTLARREYRPIAELLFEQLQRRGLSAEEAFRNLVSIVAFGRDPNNFLVGEKGTPLDQRLTNARTFVGTPAQVEPIAVWLGYQGLIDIHLSAGRVSFLNAHWAVPNTEPGRQDFAHKAELSALVRDGLMFKVAKMVDEESDIDILARVDLGNTTVADAVSRAVDIVDTILNVSIHHAGGIRPRLAQHGVIRSGEAVSAGSLAVWRETGFPDDYYGAEITAKAIEQHGPRIAEALARAQLPRFLAAAIQVQTTADHPFSRDMALRRPSEADISSVIPLSDRVVQHVAAHAAMDPNNLFALIGERWPHARWLTDLQRAAGMCRLGGGRRDELLTEIKREWFASRPKQPWILLLADRADDFLSLCRLEHERAWIARMFTSIGDHATYSALIYEYTAEGEMLEARRRRVRNALVHGNPASFTVVQSVREYADFLGGSALNRGLESFVEGKLPAAALATRTDEFVAMQGGQDAASFWRTQITARHHSGAAVGAKP
jgi:hypothetical protein